jgi:hypothetical protein
VLDKLTVSDFEGHLGAAFPAILPGGESVELRLIEASSIRSPGHVGGGREPFSLIFLGPERPALGQRVHSLGHPKLGHLEIFIVPIGPAKDQPGFRYQAIFA